MSTSPHRNNIVQAVFYGAGVGAAAVSYLARSGMVRFYYRPAFEGSVTVIDALGYPQQIDVFWYVAGFGLPMLAGLIYGLKERFIPLDRENVWWISLLIMILQAPLLMLGMWPGTLWAALHLAVLIFIPSIISRLRIFGGDSPIEIPAGTEEDDSSYRPNKWLMPALLILFGGFITYSFLILKSICMWRLIAGTILTSGMLAAGYFLMFRYIVRHYPARSSNLPDRVTMGLMPLIFLPLYIFFWSQPSIFMFMLAAAFAAGGLIFPFYSRYGARYVALSLLPLGLGLAFHLTPHIRFWALDVVHEGQQLGFVQCIFNGMLPGVEKAVKYGPLYELTEAWFMELFGMQVSVYRMYFIFTQVLGLFFACLVIRELVRRQWIVVFGWLAQFTMSIAGVYAPGHFNALRTGLPLLAIYFWSRRCRGGGRLNLLAAGAAGAAGALYSVEFGLAGSIALLTAAISRGFGNKAGEGLKLVVKEAAWTALGTCIVFIPFTVLYIVHGGLFQLFGGMYEYAEGFQSGYGAFPLHSFPLLDDPAMRYMGVIYFIRHIKYYYTLIIGSLAGALLIGKLLSGRWKAEHSALSGLAVYALLAHRSALGRSDYFHLIYATQPLAILVAVLLDRAWAELKLKISSYRSGALPAVLCLAFAATVLTAIPLIPYKLGISMINRYMNHHRFKNYASIESHYKSRRFAEVMNERAVGLWVSARQAEEIEEGVRYIKASTSPDERVYIAPFGGHYLFFADRLPLTRYCQTIDAVSPKSRKLILDKLKSARPPVIFLQPHTGHDFYYENEHREEFEYISKNYYLAGEAGELDVYKIKDEPGDEDE